MTLWFILGIMTAAALAAVAWPLMRARAPLAGGGDLAVYRDQLEEIERDRADGRIGYDEAEAARIEVSRRLLVAAAETGDTARTNSPPWRRRIAALVGAVVLLPLFAVRFYAGLGSPDLPGAPLASRAAADREAADIGALIARIERHLEEHPDDGRGWEVIAPVYLKLERFEDTAKARRNALRLLGSTAQREVDLGAALALAAGGVVTADAKAAFDRAAAMEPGNVQAMFFLGVAAQQDGHDAEAVRIWRNLMATAPPDAPWLPLVRDRLARVEPGLPLVRDRLARVAPAAAPPSQPGPTAADVAATQGMTPEARLQFIRSMVERLAARLRENRSDVDGWLRLLRAYMVMGDRGKAKIAASEAREALAGEPDKLKLLEAGLRDMGLKDLGLKDPGAEE
jgi:cytochrome c-type biogenesis protein CcmH